MKTYKVTQHAKDRFKERYIFTIPTCYYMVASFIYT